VSLSQNPALSGLSKYFVCGYRDITNESYAGASGRHDNFGNAVNTTNGAGPHNIQIFMLSPDGTVLSCLPGYWNSQDLYQEMGLAAQLNQIWENQSLSRPQKDSLFRSMQLAHVQQHSPAMSRRSHMQGFDVKYEKEHRPNSDFFGTGGAAKTVDVVMHQRMAARPFLRYENFDVAAFSDYGKPMYDKEEDYRDGSGRVDMMAARGAPKLGNVQTTNAKRQGYQEQSDPKLWGQNQNSQTRGIWGQGQQGGNAKSWGAPRS
jgi:hypothetical protein